MHGLRAIILSIMENGYKLPFASLSQPVKLRNNKNRLILDLRRENKCSVKVAEHSFQVPMPNSPYLKTIYALAPVFCKSQG